MIKITQYSQRDIRWRFKKVGFGKGNFGSVGCTTTSLASALSTLGYNLRPDDVAYMMRMKNGYLARTDLILWSVIPKVFPKIKNVIRSIKYNNSIVLDSTKKGIPVMVEVSTKSGKHWVLFIGDKKMLDPWTGKIVSTSLYTPIGYALFAI